MTDSTDPLQGPENAPDGLADSFSKLEPLLAYIRTDNFAARERALKAREGGNERVPEEDRARALGLDWLSYAILRACQIALSIDATIRLEGKAGETAGYVSKTADGCEIRDADGNYLGKITREYLQ